MMLESKALVPTVKSLRCCHEDHSKGLGQRSKRSEEVQRFSRAASMTVREGGHQMGVATVFQERLAV